MQDPSFSSGKQARLPSNPGMLTETQPAEIPRGKPQAEAPGASLHSTLSPSLSCLSKSRAAADAVLPITLTTFNQGAKLSQGQSYPSLCHSSRTYSYTQPADNPTALEEQGELGCPLPLVASPQHAGYLQQPDTERAGGEVTFDDDYTHIFVCMFSLPHTHSCYSSLLAAGLARIPSPCPPRKPRWAFAAVPWPEAASIPGQPASAGRGWQHRLPPPQRRCSLAGDAGIMGGRGEGEDKIKKKKNHTKNKH